LHWKPTPKATFREDDLSGAIRIVGKMPGVGSNVEVQRTEESRRELI
jgi:hypothetical protein